MDNKFFFWKKCENVLNLKYIYARQSKAVIAQGAILDSLTITAWALDKVEFCQVIWRENGLGIWKLDKLDFF